MKILAVMPSWLGDCLMAIPALGGLLKANGEASIDLALKPPFVSLGSLFPAIRRTVSVDDSTLRTTIRSERYDAIILFPNSFSSAWRIRGNGAAKVIGYGGEFRSLLLTESLPRPAKHSTPMVDYYLALARSLDSTVVANPLSYAIPDEAEESASKLLSGIVGPIFGVGFGANYGSAKMWGPERFAALIDRLGDEGTVVTVGAPTDKAMEERVVAMTTHHPRSLVGKTDLPTLAAVMKRMETYVTNDTGPMHLAALVGTPVVAIFGPTDPNETPPGGDGTIIYHGESCDRAPCFLRECPIDHRCMTAVSVDEVVVAALSYRS